MFLKNPSPTRSRPALDIRYTSTKVNVVRHIIPQYSVFVDWTSVAPFPKQPTWSAPLHCVQTSDLSALLSDRDSKHVRTKLDQHISIVVFVLNIAITIALILVPFPAGSSYGAAGDLSRCNELSNAFLDGSRWLEPL